MTALETRIHVRTVFVFENKLKVISGQIQTNQQTTRPSNLFRTIGGARRLG